MTPCEDVCTPVHEFVKCCYRCVGSSSDIRIRKERSPVSLVPWGTESPTHSGHMVGRGARYCINPLTDDEGQLQPGLGHTETAWLTHMVYMYTLSMDTTCWFK